MAHAGRRPTPSHNTPSPRARRLRRSQIAKNRCPSKRYVSQPTLSSSDIEQLRPVLVPLHPNLRRLPSRFLLPQQSSKGDTHSTVMRQHSHGSLCAGAKRKRVFSVNENASSNGRCTRSSGRSKRLRSSYSSGDEDDVISQSEMDVDALTISVVGSDESEHDDDGTEEVDDGVSEENSTDEYLINFADQKQLNRFRKTDLIRLYNVAGLTEDPETLTKPEIIAAIIDARDDYASVPPSSRTGKSSDYSSDDGNVAGDEETDGGSFDANDGPALNLRRRATIHELGKSSSMAHKGRSFSLGNIATHNVVSPSKTRYRTNSNDSAGSNSKASISPSPTSSVSSGIWPVRSPPATRLRSRQVSHTVGAQTDKQKSPISGPPTPGKGSKGKAKGKQVGFKQDVGIHAKAPVRHGKDETLYGGESDLTELSELEKSFSAKAPQPSPRRLRSKDRQRTTSCASVPSQSLSTPKKRKHPSPPEEREAKQDGRAERTNKARVLPTRRAKLARETSKEVVEEDVDEEDELVEDESEEIGSQDEEGDDEEEEDEIEDEEAVEEVDQGSEEEEVDELASSASATSSPRTRRTPLRKRLRSRQKQGSAGPSDGDDEGDGGRVLRRREAESPDIEGQDEEDVEADAASEMADDEETIAVEPRRLRNGKIVGEEDVEMDNVEDLGEDVEQEEEGDESNDDTVDEEDGGNEDAEGEIDEEVMDEEVDLTIATAKTLVRLRRDDLVRLCESCDLEPVGTKPQLAQALLQWRDQQSNECSSPSSAGTVRPPSTTKRRRYHTRHQSSEAQTPILSRSHRVHLDEPRTPAPDKEEKDKEKEGEQDLELDLESLGLEDREIPPDKLHKLEKIGSGGFKDVYIGKFKGRKIAIAEFRGQLNAMDIKELKLLGEFNHPNIVRFLGVSIPENVRETPVMIVSELCSNGDLFDYIRNVNAPPLRKILVMMLDISRGLEYLHTRKPSVIHRDCKSSNILITSKGIAKIADFGLAKVKQSTRSMVRSLVGTVNWQAPELWHAHPKYNHKADVFSCAAVYWEMLQWHLPKANRKFPWEGMNEHAIYEIVGTKRQRPSVAGLRKQWCPEIIDMIEHMWVHDPQDRPTMSEVVQKLEELAAKF